MPTIGQAKATLVDKIDSLTASATAKDTIYLAKALKENTNHHSFTFQGAWAATTAYALDDVVTNGGNTYICIAAHTSGASFSVGSNWTMMAAAGTTVGTGTAGQVLKTNAAGNGIEWGTDEGGSMVKILKTTITNGTNIVNIDSVFSTQYKQYKVIMRNIVPQNDSNQLYMRLNTSTGAELTGSNYKSFAGGAEAYSSGANNDQTRYFFNNSKWDLTGGGGTLDSNGVKGGANYSLNFYDPYTTDRCCVWNGLYSYQRNDEHNLILGYCGGIYNNDGTEAYRGFRLEMASGTFKKGEIIVYGIVE